MNTAIRFFLNVEVFGELEVVVLLNYMIRYRLNVAEHCSVGISSFDLFISSRECP